MKTSDKSRDQLVDEIEALKARLATVEALESELPTIFRVAMQQTPASIAIIDFEGNLKYINPAVKRSHGYDPDELIGKHLSIFHSSDQLPDVEAFVNEVRTTGKATAEIGHTRRDGTTFPALMQGCLLHDGSGNPIGMLGTLSDISDLKRMEAKLLESEERHCKWLDHAGDAVFIFDAGGRFTRVNNRACESLGYSPDELLALKVWDVEIGWKRKELEALFQVVLKSPPAIKEGVQRRRDGSTFPVEVRIGPVREESEDLILVIARDISERRRVEEKLRAAQEFLEKVMDLSPFAMWIADSDGTVLQTNLGVAALSRPGGRTNCGEVQRSRGWESRRTGANVSGQGRFRRIRALQVHHLLVG